MGDATPNVDGRRIVLCAVADDDHLQNVVAAGRALALTASFRVLFVHVAAPAVRLRTPAGFAGEGGSHASELAPPSSNIGDLREQARRAGRDLVRGAGIAEEESIVAAGEPVVEINRLAVEHGAALVVVGSHGRGSISSALVSSVSRKLARDGACPVFVARSRVLPCQGGPVVCGIDVHDDDGHATGPAVHAARLARLMDRPLVLVHVLVADQRLRRAAETMLAPVALKPTQRQRSHGERVRDAAGLPRQSLENIVLEGASVASALDRFAAGRRADLLVVGCRPRGIVERALEGGALTDLLRNGRQPLVIVPPGCASTTTSAAQM